MTCTPTKCTPLAKRLCLATLIGTIFGILCFTGFSQNPNFPAEMAKYQLWSASNPMMWEIIINRMTVGFVIGLMGFITVHPVFGFKLPVFLRGFMIGAFVSLTMSFGAMIENPEATQTFWIITLAGGIIGMITDLIVTKVAGQGKDLYEK